MSGMAELIGTINQAVIEAFSAIPEVEAIYREDVYSRVYFWIFTGNAQYADALMDRLIGCEDIIHDAYESLGARMAFSFPPSEVCSDHQGVMGVGAVLIWRK
jgi:hypothetical protein